jgi:MscS family membrane protein
MVVESVISESYAGSTIPQYVLFFGILALGAIAGRILSFLLERRLSKAAQTTETAIDDIIIRSLGGPIALLGVFVAAALGRGVLTPTQEAERFLSTAVEVPLIISAAWIAIRLTDGLIKNYIGRYADQTASKLDDALVPIVSRMTNIAIISISTIVVLDSIGYDVTAIIASLGIGGIALAFAARRTLSDVFGGAHILSTKPFLVDDVIEVDGTAGTVEEIGLRTTRIRDFDGRRITLPNSTLANAEVTNVSSEPTRRIKTFIGLSYATTPAEMEAALELAEETVGAVDGVDPERTEALFWEYGATALRIRIEYHIRARGRWPSVKDAINRTIQRAFADAGVDLALPVRPVPVDDRRS